MPALPPRARLKRFRWQIASICKYLSEAVQRLLARVLSAMKTASQKPEGTVKVQEETSVSVEEWRPD
jgi:hypothetical protein